MARILIIDDNDDNLALSSYLLGRRGHVTILASRGQAGVDAAATEAPDLILVDILMPGMDGFRTARAIRANPATAATPMLAMSAASRATSTVPAEAVAEGSPFDGFFALPVDPEAFGADVERYADATSGGGAGAEALG